MFAWMTSTVLRVKQRKRRYDVHSQHGKSTTLNVETRRKHRAKSEKKTYSVRSTVWWRQRVNDYGNKLRANVIIKLFTEERVQVQKTAKKCGKVVNDDSDDDDDDITSDELMKSDDRDEDENYCLKMQRVNGWNVYRLSLSRNVVLFVVPVCSIQFNCMSHSMGEKRANSVIIWL